MSEVATNSRLSQSVDSLKHLAPQLSAHEIVDRRTRWVLIAVAVLIGLVAVARPLATGIVLMSLLTLGYVATVCYRVALVWMGTRARNVSTVSDAEARAVPEAELPVYSVLLPALHEPHIADLLQAVNALEYPREKLDVILLLEQNDDITIEAARAADLGPHISVVIVPPGGPQTKPRACNYGLLDARGELVTIFDAEDQPEPLQLRRAYAALRDLGPQFACVQAELGFYNSAQNLLTKFFTLDYGMWFRFLLPGLVGLGSPVPLGGTSNHFRTEALLTSGAWDPYNVTEDADLGVRLSRLGYRVGVLQSVTYEEANSDWINWIKQRSRWYKGYLVTFLVHSRQPVTVARELGWRGLLGMTLFVGGTPLFAALNPLMWGITLVWLFHRSAWINLLFPAPFYYLAMLSMVVGNFAMIYMNVLAVRELGKPRLLVAALLNPLYWVLMSLAACKAALQLVLQPTYWEKTMHGLGTVKPASAPQEATA